MVKLKQNILKDKLRMKEIVETQRMSFRIKRQRKTRIKKC